MFYVGAVLMVDGRYTFSKMVEVFTLILFSITFSSQIMAHRAFRHPFDCWPGADPSCFTSTVPHLTKSTRACVDLTRLLDLSLDTAESHGQTTLPIAGRIVFDQVDFAYPQRQEVQVLRGMSFVVEPGECVGIVG